MRFGLTMDDPRKVMAQAAEEVSGVVTTSMREAGELLKADLRDDVERAGLGVRLGRAWRLKVYPTSGTSLDAAAFVYTTAAKIIDSYDRGATIVATNGRRYLAIPTQDTPRKRSGNALTPREVETRFGKPLFFIAAGDRAFWSPSIRRGDVVGFLVIKGLVPHRATGRWRNATKNELPGGKRRYQKSISMVIMFNLVTRVKKPNLLNIDATAQRGADRVGGILDKNWRA